MSHNPSKTFPIQKQILIQVLLMNETWLSLFFVTLDYQNEIINIHIIKISQPDWAICGAL